MNGKEIRSQIKALLKQQQDIALAGFTSESREKFLRIQKDVEALEASSAQLESVADKIPEERRKAINAAFRDYALKGLDRMSRETRDLLTISDTTGGALIPQSFSGIFADAQRFYGPIAQKVDQKITDDKGIPIKISFDNDTGNGLTLLSTEGTSSPAETDPPMSSKILGVDTVSGGLVKVSFQELEDSSFDLDSFLRNKFAIRHARGLENIVTNGKDSSGNALPNSSTGGLLGMATAIDTTVALMWGIAWDDLTTAFGALDPAYIGPDTAWVMNSNTRAYLLGYKDSFGRPLYQIDPATNKPFSQLLGFDVVLSQSIPDMGANAIPILFGDLQKSYILRTDGQPSIQRLNQRYADSLAVGFHLYSRVGGLTKNAGVSPIVAIKMAAS